jgi:hypothetical protein
MPATPYHLTSELKRTADAVLALRAALEALPRGEFPADAQARAELAAIARAAENEMLGALEETEGIARTLEH